MTENQEQIALIKWAYDRAIYNITPELALLFHIPNERKCTPAQGYFLQKMGVKSGVPDLFLPVARGRYHGLFIEMKAQKGRLSENQANWLKDLRLQGYAAAVCYGAREAIDIITKYFAQEDINDG